MRIISLLYFTVSILLFFILIIKDVPLVTAFIVIFAFNSMGIMLKLFKIEDFDLKKRNEIYDDEIQNLENINSQDLQNNRNKKVRNAILAALFVLIVFTFAFYLIDEGMPFITVLIICIMIGWIATVLKVIITECIYIIKNPKKENKRTRNAIFYILITTMIFILAFYLTVKGVPFFTIIIMGAIIGGLASVLKKVIEKHIFHQQ